jgi:hypothetical protein
MRLVDMGYFLDRAEADGWIGFTRAFFNEKTKQKLISDVVERATYPNETADKGCSAFGVRILENQFQPEHIVMFEGARQRGILDLRTGEMTVFDFPLAT